MIGEAHVPNAEILVRRLASVDTHGAPIGTVPHAVAMDSVLTTAQAYRRFGRNATINNLRRGQWRRPVRGVVVTHNGPLDQVTRQCVVLAASQSGAALGGLTA